MKLVKVDEYDIVIGRNLDIAKKALELVPNAAVYVVVTDDNINNLYGEAIRNNFSGHGAKVLFKALPPGEISKSRQGKAEIEDWMFENHCNRDTCLIAIGGGVIGDLVGYVAATFMRGIPYIQVPTTVLAMVDSSVGGKTAIDAPAGKNLIGAFYKPVSVLCDLDFVKTLPKRELSNGLAEAIKAGAIKSAELFEFFESNVEGLMSKDVDLLSEVVAAAVQIKADVVREDFKEGGLRAILNFGHSIGHAIEHYMQPGMLHGECISIGMIEEAVLARSLGYLQSSHIRRLESVLKAYGLPTTVPHGLTVSMILKAMAIDKKNKRGKKMIVMLTSIGSVHLCPSYTVAVSDTALAKTLCDAASVLPGTAMGTVAVPGSKSISNRVLLLAAMGLGPCRITGLLHSQDTQVMLTSLKQLGVAYEWENHEKTLLVHGCGGRIHPPSKELWLHNAGTAARFLTSLVATLHSGEATLTGNKRMQERPVKDLIDALRTNGVACEYKGREGCLPVTIQGGGFRGGRIQLKASVSSQFVSSILLSAPFAKSPTTLVLEGRAVSRPYITMTTALMRDFGVVVNEIDSNTFSIPCRPYVNPPTYQVEGDASSASYPLAFAAVTGGTVTVSNVGSASLQGDANFVQLLKQMGCAISQTALSTTVTGPSLQLTDGKAQARIRAVAGHLDGKSTQVSPILTAIQVDMDKMTDCFMTLAVVAAVAEGTTDIVNIANQRVKECDRIAATVAGLKAVGINASELPTGIRIVGSGSAGPTTRPSPVALIDTHDDHRIAMSFAVLSSRLGNIVSLEKRCVGKTYPEFWEHCEKYLGLTLDHATPVHSAIGDDTSGQHISGPASSPALTSLTIGKRLFELPSGGLPTVVIIGMRGAGKTGLGMKAASSLGYRFIDIDHVIEHDLKGETIKDYIARSSWSQFRETELATFRKVLTNCASGWVVSCGGGIVETPACRQILKSHRMVFEVRRDMDSTEKYLNADKTRPPVDIRSVWAKRKPWFDECGRFRLQLVPGETNWIAAGKELTTMIKMQIGSFRVQSPRAGTFFLSLTYTDVNDCLEVLPTVSAGVDALELRVDMLRNYSEEFVADQVSILRRHSHLPIIFTVRSKGQGGKFPDDPDALFALNHLAVKLSVPFVDMETHWPQKYLDGLLNNRFGSKIIASHHEFNSNGGSEDNLRRIYTQCSQNGRADVVKVVVMATCEQDAIRLMRVAQDTKLPNSPPLISLAMGAAGQISRVLNKVFTPVTHPMLPVKAAPGQMSMLEIQKARTLLGLSASRFFCIFGSPVTFSPSPTLHNAGFQWCGLPYHYDRFDTSDIQEVKKVIGRQNFAGASVTIPLKESVIPLLDHVSEAVSRIGACNTITKLTNGQLYGDNTDWLGICACIRPVLPSPAASDVAIVVGAGGTARAALFAMQQLGFTSDQLCVFNPRTESKARSLATEFKCLSLPACTVSAVKSVCGSSATIRVIVSTVPGKVGFSLAACVVAHKPVIMDVSYLPKRTPLLDQAEAAGLSVARGIDMLIAQGVGQFELWTERTSVEPIVEKAVRDFYAGLETVKPRL